MKKTIIAITVLFALSLAACGQQPASTNTQTSSSSSVAPATGTSAIESAKTIGEARTLATRPDSIQNALYGDYVIFAFEKDNTYYQVIAEAPEDVADAIFALKFTDPDYDRKNAELIDPLTITIYKNLNDGIPAQEDVDAYIGKTLKDLEDADWTNSGWNLDTMEFWMNYGPYFYTVIAEGEVKDADNFDTEDMYPLTIKSITYNGIKDATHIELDDNDKIVQ